MSSPSSSFHAAVSRTRPVGELDTIALTKGPAGSCLYRRRRYSEHPGYDAKVADTVGAGDSFTAVLAGGLLMGDDLDAINDRANKTAAYVCSQPGAMPKLIALE